MALEEEGESRTKIITPRYKSFPVRGGVLIRKGAIVCKRRGSFLAEVPLSSAKRTDLIPLGVAMCLVDATDKADGECKVLVEAGGYRDFATGTAGNAITANMVGETFYLYDDNTLYATDDGGTLSPGGEVMFVDTSSFDGSTQVSAFFDWERMDLLSQLAELKALVAP